VATTLLVAGPTLTFAYLGRLRLHPPARTQASLKGARSRFRNYQWYMNRKY